MSSRRRPRLRPRSPPSEQEVPNLDLEWKYHEDTRLILHDADACETCDRWARHYFLHTSRDNETLQDAKATRDYIFLGRYEQWRPEVMSLRAELEELKEVVAGLRDDAITLRRRKYARRARTPSPTPSVVEVSPGPSHDGPRNS